MAKLIEKYRDIGITLEMNGDSITITCEGELTDELRKEIRGNYRQIEVELTAGFSADQERAWDDLMFFYSGSAAEHALSGAAGTGKTFVITRFVDMLTKDDEPIHLTATTNKAARVAAEMGDSKAITIHSLLGLRPMPDDNRGVVVLRQTNPPRVRRGAIVVIDESSMVQEDLLWRIRSAAKKAGAKVLYVGDAYQLPPVFEVESPVFRLVESQSHLTKIHRQALENPIIAVATKFREVLDGAKFPVVAAAPPGVILLDRTAYDAQILEAFRNDEDTRVLTWTNNAARRYNKMIRDDKYDCPVESAIVGETLVVNSAIEQYGELIFSTDEMITVMEVEADSIGSVEGQTVLATGESGKASIFIPRHWQDAADIISERAKLANSMESEKSRMMKADEKISMSFEAERKRLWREFFSIQKEFADVRPPFASTVHKSQGSTYDSVYVDLDDIGKNTKWHETARLLYVALTRAANVVYATGELPSRLYVEKVA